MSFVTFRDVLPYTVPALANAALLRRAPLEPPNTGETAAARRKCEQPIQLGIVILDEHPLMSTWTPAQKDLHPLQNLVHELARHLLMPAVVPSPAPRSAEGWHSLVLANGQRASVALELVPRAETKFGPRAALAYDVKGRATLETHGYIVSGDLVVDRATRAFLQVECRLEPLGKVA